MPTIERVPGSTRFRFTDASPPPWRSDEDPRASGGRACHRVRLAVSFAEAGVGRAHDRDADDAGLDAKAPQEFSHPRSPLPLGRCRALSRTVRASAPDHASARYSGEMLRPRVTMRRIKGSASAQRGDWGLSDTAVSRQCRSRSTLKEYLDRAAAAGLSWEISRRFMQLLVDTPRPSRGHFGGPRSNDGWNLTPLFRA
jgi:hypothetical protein